MYPISASRRAEVRTVLPFASVLGHGVLGPDKTVPGIDYGIGGKPHGGELDNLVLPRRAGARLDVKRDVLR